MQEGEPYLAATARPTVIRVSPATAGALGLQHGSPATVSAGDQRASATLIVTDGMVDGVVWVPSLSEGASLSLASGSPVKVSAGVSHE